MLSMLYKNLADMYILGMYNLYMNVTVISQYMIH